MAPIHLKHLLFVEISVDETSDDPRETLEYRLPWRLISQATQAREYVLLPGRTTLSNFSYAIQLLVRPMTIIPKFNPLLCSHATSRCPSPHLRR